MVKRSDGANTKQKLLSAAASVFARKGYRETTVAEICHEAGANIASVNYYFGSKEELYVEAWRYVFDKSIEMYPPDGGIPANAPVAERFRGHIASVVLRVLDPASLDFDIAHRELANPTGLLAQVMHESLEPLHQQMLTLVRELVGPRAPEQQADLCCFSVMAQCMECAHHKRRHFPPMPDGVHKPLLADADVQQIVEHIYRFSLAGIECVYTAGSAGSPAMKEARTK